MKREDYRKSETNPTTTRRFTTFLSENKYKEVYMEEFREEDIEVMQINSQIKLLDQTLKRVALF